MSMTPYTLSEVRALPVGSDLYIEFREFFPDVTTGKVTGESGDKFVEDADGAGFWPADDDTPRNYGRFYRCWPSQPSEGDKAAAKWEATP